MLPSPCFRCAKKYLNGAGVLMADERTRPEDFPEAVHQSLARLHAAVKVKGKDRKAALAQGLVRWATDEEIALAQLQRQPYHCVSTSRLTGLPCRNRAVMGATICRFHGAKREVVRAAIDDRLLKMAGPALREMYEMATAREHTRVKQDAAADILDRAGVGQLVEAKVRQSYRGQSNTGVTVQIGFLQTMRPQLLEMNGGQSLLPPADAIDAETAAPGPDHDEGTGD